jgi:hypothetical protein
MIFVHEKGLVGVKHDDFDRLHVALDGFLINRTGMLDFPDPMLREAVQRECASAPQRDFRRGSQF